MNGNDVMLKFDQDLDRILNEQVPLQRDDTLPEYNRILDMASSLKQADFGTDGNKEKIRRKAMHSYYNNEKKDHTNRKEAIGMKMRRPALAAAALVILAVVFVTLASPKTMVAMTNNAAYHISKILKVGNYITIMQVENTAPQKPNPLSQQQEKELKEKGVVTIENPDGTQVIVSSKDYENPNIIKWDNIAKARLAASFPVLTPAYLPAGYSFSRAESFKGSKDYLNLFYQGSGGKIILMQRAMNEETKFETGSEMPIESVDINGSTGVLMDTNNVIWEKDGISYDLICKGFNREETLKVARSVK